MGDLEVLEADDVGGFFPLLLGMRGEVGIGVAMLYEPTTVRARQVAGEVGGLVAWLEVFLLIFFLLFDVVVCSDCLLDGGASDFDDFTGGSEALLDVALGGCLWFIALFGF